MRQAILLIIIALLYLLPTSLWAENSFVKIGVLNHLGKARSEIIQSWESIADYLSMILPEYDFEIVPLHSIEIVPAITEERVDFILTNPNTFVLLSENYGIRPLATLNSHARGISAGQYASVIITHRDNDDINTLADIRDKTVVAVEQSSFSGFLMAWREMKKININPFNDFFQLSFIHNHEQVVSAVINEHYEVGILGSNRLERLIHSQHLNPNRIKIINSLSSAHFPLTRSTPFYPNWTFSATTSIDSKLADSVTLALVRMSTQQRMTWTLPQSHQPVIELLTELQLPPFEPVDKQTIYSLVKQYWYFALMAGVLLLTLIIGILMAIRRNQRLKISKEKLASRYQLVVDSVADGVYGIDNQGCCTFINKAMQDMTGWTSKEVLNKKLFSIMHHTRQDGLPTTIQQCPMHQSFKDEQAYFIEDDIFWCKDGHSIAVEYSSTPLKNKQGDIIGGVVVFRDITERKAYQEKLHQHEQKLRHVARLNTLGEITSGIAHEINQPLTAIATNAKTCIRMLENNVSNNEECADIMEKITSQAERAGKVIRNMRQFIQKDQRPLSKVHIESMLTIVNDLIQHDLSKHLINFTLLHQSSLYVHANEIQIQQVLINLIKNAIDSVRDLPEQRRNITVAYYRHQDKIRFEVCDTGEGIKQAIKEQLFESFITTKVNGLGLGLSISQNIIEAHGDKIQIISKPNQVCFYFMLNTEKR